MKKLSSNWRARAVIATGVVALLIWAVPYYLQSLAFHGDYGAQPPAAVFQDIFGQPVPDGVADLRASGRRYFTRAWVWLRFRASDAALKKIVTDDDQGDAGDRVALLSGTQWVGNHRYDSVDLKAVGWDDVPHIRKPVFYTFASRPVFQPKPDTYNWIGNLIVDPETHVVYAEFMGD